MWKTFYEKAEADLRKVLDKVGFVIDEEYHDENSYNVFCHGEEIEKCMKEVKALTSISFSVVVEKNESLSYVENICLLNLFKNAGLDYWNERNPIKKNIEDFYPTTSVDCVVYFDTKYYKRKR